MYAVYCRIPAFYRDIPHAPAWMNVNFNRERRCFMPAVDGRQEFAFHTQLKPHEDEERVSDESAAGMVRQAIGAPLAVEVLARDTWTAGHSLVAERFGAGRVFIGGDAAHLFTPTGGLGYNTAVEDAVNLGWKLAAVLKGQAAPRLLESYDAERRPLAVRNTTYAKGFADSLGIEPPREIEDESAAGEAARSQAGSTSRATGRPNSTSRASRSAAATTIRPRSFPTDPRRPGTGRTSMCRRGAREGDRRTCGSQTGARSSMPSASSGPSCGLERPTARGSSARPAGLAWISPCSTSGATKRASSTGRSSRSSVPTRWSPGAATTTAPRKACSRG
jgi:hypothetical protein